MPQVRLSILIAMYNEANSINIVLERVAAAIASLQISSEVIVIDNGSHDHSYEVVELFAQTQPGLNLRLMQRIENAGKGAAIRMAIDHAHGEFCIIQDADFEYDPADYPNLLAPLLCGEADVVLGSRFLFGTQRRPLGFWQAVVNHLISGVSSFASGLALSDVETGYKAFRTSLAQSIPLYSNTFGLDPEIVIQFVKRRARFVEVPINYHARTLEQGKKIRALDTLDALWTIARTQLFSPAHKDAGANILATMSRAHRFNRWMADTIAPFIKGDVLEVGAGIGNLTMLLANDEHRYVATDTDEESLAELRRRMQYRRSIECRIFDFSKAEQIDLFRKSADTIVCLNVLEHVAEDQAALANMRECIRPGGMAIVLVPQDPNLFGSLDEVLEHKRRYTKEELSNKISSAGLRLVQMIEFNRATRPGWFLNSKVLRRTTISPLQLRFFDLLVPLWRRIDQQLPWPANSLIAIGVADD